MNEKLKEIIAKIASELLKNGLDAYLNSSEPAKDEVKPVVQQVSPPEKVESPTKVASNVEPNKRFFKLAPNLYYARSVVMTCFANKADFNGETYQLGTGSKLGKVYKGKMKGVRGISLPYPINNSLIAYPINPKNGILFGYSQVDVGPGYTDDSWWTKNSVPKTESTGKDYLGNPSAKAGIDAFPQVFEDLGFCTFEEAYEKGFTAVVDLIIYQPEKTGTKTEGHEIPTSDSRQWVKELPRTGSEFFSWTELLRGWNRKERPSDEQIANLLALVKDILHPCRVAVGEIRIGSALRDPETNKRVGGVTNSLHMQGRAADLVPVHVSCTKLHEWIKQNINGKIRENVLEDVGTSNEHTHVAGPIKSGEINNTKVK